MTKKKFACFGMTAVLVMTGSFIFGSGVLFSGCKGEKGKNIDSVRIDGLDIYYLPTDFIDFDAVTLGVTYDDGTETVLTDKVFDVEDDSAADAEFVLYTDGVASGELMADVGAYNAAVTNYFVDGIDMNAVFPLPITFSTDRGTIFALDAGMTGVYDPVALRNNGYAGLPGEEVGLTEEDSQVYVYYRMGSVGIGLVVSLFDIE